MPNRILREGILTSERIERLNWAEEVFYRRLMSVVDDYGRYYARPALLLAACYPLLLKKVSDSDIEKWLTACVNAALVRVYPAQDGKRYLELVDFKQQVRAATSKFPQPPIPCAADATQGTSECEASAHLVGVVSVVGDEDDKPAVPAFVLPSWIPGDTWSAYLQTRTDKRTKNGAHALGLIVKDLEAFRAAGHDPVEILNSSIKSGWAGVFAPKAFLSVVGVTVPGASGRDPALQKLDDDARRTTGPSLATLEKMAQLRGKVTA